MPSCFATYLNLRIVTRTRRLLFWSTGLHFQLPRHRAAYFETCYKPDKNFQLKEFCWKRWIPNWQKLHVNFWQGGWFYFFFLYRKPNKIKTFHFYFLLKKDTSILVLHSLIWTDVPFRFFSYCAEETCYKAWKQHKEIHCGWKTTFI